ncbi:MAG: hypothetical protein JWP01_1100 [Myxococcales bacterium]|nr:hypothetical protein [Myxococcales bacterium]
MQRFLLFVSVLLAGCSGGPPRGKPPTSEAQPTASTRAFVDRMLAALEATDLREWRNLLSERMRSELGNNAASVHDHLAAWRRELLPIARELRAADVAVDALGHVSYTLGGEAQQLALVVIEHGALHLDEN